MPSQYEIHLSNNNGEEIRKLLADGTVPPNAIYDPSSQSKQTILMFACEHRNDAWVECLLEYGADPNAIDWANWTAAMYAATAGDVKSLRMLIAAGADINKKNNMLQNALGLSVENNNFDISCARLLLLHGIDTDNVDNDGKTAIDLAKNTPNGAKYIAEINKKNLLATYGNSFLVLVAIWGSELDLQGITKQKFSAQEWNNALNAAKDAQRDTSFVQQLTQAKNQVAPAPNPMLTAKFWIDIISYPFRMARDLIKKIYTTAAPVVSAAAAPQPEPYETWSQRYPKLYNLLHDWHEDLARQINIALAKNDIAAYERINAELKKYEQAWESLWIPYQKNQIAAFKLAAATLLDRLEDQNKEPLFETMRQSKTVLSSNKVVVAKSIEVASQIKAIRAELDVARMASPKI